MRTFIHGGLVVNATQTSFADVLIEGETVVGVVTPGHELGKTFLQTANTIVDASGKYVIPGGIDVHTHLESIGQGTFVPDTFETGTRAAAIGGTTTIVDFASPKQGESMRGAVESHFETASGNCAIDFGFHVFCVGAKPSTLDDMDALIDEGVSSFKMFMAYPGSLYSNDGEILQVMQRAALNGGLVMMHAENGIAIDVLRDQAVARGERAPRFHAITRPSLLEAEAINRASIFAEIANVPLYIVHLSSEDALRALVKARLQGRNVFAETCPQYLFLDDSYLDGDPTKAANYVCSPPLRPKSHQAAMWRGLALDELQLVATDHCPFCTSQREVGRDDFRIIPNGLPGIEHRVEQMFSGVVSGHISLTRWVEIISTSPAKMFGMFPKKGSISPGSDADIVIFDPHKKHTISASTHNMNVDFSAYEGNQLMGKVETVFLRGSRIVQDSSYIGSKHDGSFVKRGLCQHIK
jgi:dihydropyrimidinase